MIISIIGTGSWGCALAQSFSKNSNITKVKIYGRNEAINHEINSSHTNEKYLPNLLLDRKIHAFYQIEEACIDSELIFILTPMAALAEICMKLASFINKNQIIINCAKGIEPKKLLIPTEVIEHYLPNQKIAILSGPNFALEVAFLKPAITSVAAKDMHIAKHIASSLSQEFFRIYPNNDVITTQIAAACKNILAIACGIANGLDLGENAKAALITRGISEITKIAVALGGVASTMMEPAGIGDIFLTCSSEKSRNFTFGNNIAKNSNIADLLSANTIEGYHSAAPIYNLCKKVKIDAPITEAIYDILHHGLEPKAAMIKLLSRKLSFS